MIIFRKIYSIIPIDCGNMVGKAANRDQCRNPCGNIGENRHRRHSAGWQLQNNIHVVCQANAKRSQKPTGMCMIDMVDGLEDICGESSLIRVHRWITGKCHKIFLAVVCLVVADSWHSSVDFFHCISILIICYWVPFPTRLGKVSRERTSGDSTSSKALGCISPNWGKGAKDPDNHHNLVEGSRAVIL